MTPSRKPNERQDGSEHDNPNRSEGASSDAGPAAGPQALPLGALPAPLARLALEASEALSAPPDLVAVPALAVLGAAIGNSRAVRVKPGWTEYPIIYSAVVADPGERKSPALRFAIRPLHMLQEEMKRAFREERRRFEAERAVVEAKTARSREGKKSATREPSSEAREPRMAVAMVTDSTWEAIADTLTYNERGITYVADELTGWVRSHNAYRGGKGSDRQAWLSAWSGTPVIVNRKSLPEPLVLTSPFVAITGGLPPDVLDELTDERGRQDGFIHRLLFSYPRSVPARWTEAGVTDETQDGYCALFGELHNLEPGPQGRPVVVGFTRCGREAFVAFLESDHYPALGSAPEALRGPLAKLEAYFARLALISHCCRVVLGETESEDIDEVSVQAAAELIRYFRSHAAHVYRRLGSTDEDRKVEAVASYARRQGSRVSLRDIQRSRVAGVRTASDVQTICKALEERGLGAVELRESVSGKASHVLVLTEPTRHPTKPRHAASDPGSGVASGTRRQPDRGEGVERPSDASPDTSTRSVEPKTVERRLSGDVDVAPTLPGDAPECERDYWRPRRGPVGL